MFKKPHCPVIAIEEHYWDEELAKTYSGGEAGRQVRGTRNAGRAEGVRFTRDLQKDRLGQCA